MVGGQARSAGGGQGRGKGEAGLEKLGYTRVYRPLSMALVAFVNRRQRRDDHKAVGGDVPHQRPAGRQSFGKNGNASWLCATNSQEPSGPQLKVQTREIKCYNFIIGSLTPVLRTEGGGVIF